MITNPPAGHELTTVNRGSRIATRSDDPFVRVIVLPGGKYYVTQTAICECGRQFLPGDSIAEHERHVFAVIWAQGHTANRQSGRPCDCVNPYEDLK